MGGKAPDNYRSRLEYELNVICDMGFASYMLIVADFVSWAKERGIPVGPGRGSAAGALTCYALGITDLDPLVYGLHFERFLNPARKSMPDIDIDFEPSGRGEVIEYVAKKYGEEHVCQIVTFNRLKARAAIRDVGRVMDIPLSEVDKVAKLVPWGDEVDGALKNPEFQRIYQSSALYKEWIDTARRLEGFTRNVSIHAAGVIICADPIWYHAPVQVMEGQTMSVCMYSMEDAEKVGLVKMDFLGLRTLTYLRDTIINVKTTKGIEIDLARIPLDDPVTYRMLGAGDVMGVFQMEGEGMRDLLVSIAPDKLDDLIACIALFRPGPMENDLHRAYARRKNGREPVTVKHPDLEPILGPTYGILTYQEQISLILQALGGMDLGTATLLIKLISKKKERATISKYKMDFIKGAIARGVEADIAHAIWQEMEAFAGYGFNKAHSAAYGLIAYQTAYLKANYPREFYAAYLSSEMHNQEKIAVILEEMKRKGIPVYGPDVNHSRAWFSVENDGVRYGLAAIKGVGIQAAEAISAAREEYGPYQDIFQLVARVDPHWLNKGVLEALIGAGACDCFKASRKAMLLAIPDALERGKKQREDLLKGQVALFGAGVADAGPPLSKDEFPAKELLRMEREYIGFYLSHHPLEEVWDKIKPYITSEIARLKDMHDGSRVRVGGMLTSVMSRTSKKDRLFATFNLEDFTGKVKCIMFPDAYDKFGVLLENEAFVVLGGRIKIEESEVREGVDEEDTGLRRDVRIIAEELWRLDPEATDESQRFVVPAKSPADITLVDHSIMEEESFYLDDEEITSVGNAVVNIVLDPAKADKETIRALKSCLVSKKGPMPVKFHFPIGGRWIIVDAGSEHGVAFTQELKTSLLGIPGVEDVSVRL